MKRQEIGATSVYNPPDIVSPTMGVRCYVAPSGNPRDDGPTMMVVLTINGMTIVCRYADIEDAISEALNSI